MSYVIKFDRNNRKYFEAETRIFNKTCPVCGGNITPISDGLHSSSGIFTVSANFECDNCSQKYSAKFELDVVFMECDTVSETNEFEKFFMEDKDD